MTARHPDLPSTATGLRVERIERLGEAELALLTSAARVDGTAAIGEGLLVLGLDPDPSTRVWRAILLPESSGPSSVPEAAPDLHEDAPSSTSPAPEAAPRLAGLGVAGLQGERQAAEALVDPELRGHGFGRALVTAMDAELRAASAGAWMWSHGDHPAAARLAADLGYTRERDLLQIHTDPLASLDLPEVEAPEGVTIRAFAPGDEDGWLRVNNAAFDWHPEQGHQTLADITDITQPPGFDPGSVVIAEARGEVAGFHVTKIHAEHPSGLRVGEVYVLGVDPQVHARGIGRALTLAGMRYLESRGVDMIELYVESDNARALRLYTGLGFVHRTVHVSYRPH